MLTHLSIRDIVLIRKLDLDFSGGLTVLTGETGAGKSILLDALGLALGRRGDASLLRRGSERASVTATFEPPADHPSFQLLEDQGLGDGAEILLLRRTLTADGRSRAFINDQPVSVGLLRNIGDALVEVHGQHDDRGLFDPAGHRRLLDLFGGHEGLLADVRRYYGEVSQLESALQAARDEESRARQDEDYLRHAREELEALAVETGEETALAEERSYLREAETARESVAEIFTQLSGEEPVDARLRSALRRLEHLPAPVRSKLADTVKHMGRAVIEAAEAVSGLEDCLRELDIDPKRQDEVEERLFAIRALARKHRCQADDLPDVLDRITREVEAIDRSGERIGEIEAELSARRGALRAAAGNLSNARKEAAGRLDEGVNRELPVLKLDKAAFRAGLIDLAAGEISAEGAERVDFEVATNAGDAFGPLRKIASGGELARIILALKVVLAGKGSAPTMIFDEVDRGVGGAVADAVGNRLKALSRDTQLLTVTHSPQVASKGDHHWLIRKSETDGRAEALVTRLGADGRTEEVARMLSGQAVTDEARAAADSLLEQVS